MLCALYLVYMRIYIDNTLKIITLAMWSSMWWSHAAATHGVGWAAAACEGSAFAELLGSLMFGCLGGAGKVTGGAALIDLCFAAAGIVGGTGSDSIGGGSATLSVGALLELTPLPTTLASFASACLAARALLVF